MADQSYDARRFKLCAPWDGTRGAAYTRRFKPQICAAFHGIDNDKNTLFDHLISETDPGGVNGTAIPPANNQANNDLRTERKLFANKAFSLIRSHVLDTMIQNEIDTVAGNANCGVMAWAIVEAYGNATESNITDINRDNLWTAVSIKSVGIVKRTPMLLRSYIIQLNDERAAIEQYSEEQMCRKFLSCIKFPPLIRTVVTTELQKATHVYPVGHARAGERNFVATTGFIQELWDSEFDNNNIRAEAAPVAGRAGGNRFDANLADGEDCDDDMPELCEDEAFAFGEARSTGDSIKGETSCWNCKGFGHRKKGDNGLIECPSPLKNRNFQDCIEGLKQCSSQQSGRSSKGFSKKASFGGRGNGKRPFFKNQPGKKPASANVAEDVDASLGVEVPDGFQLVAVDASGNAFSADGEQVFSIGTDDNSGGNNTEASKPILKKQQQKSDGEKQVEFQMNMMEVDENDFFSSCVGIEMAETLDAGDKENERESKRTTKRGARSCKASLCKSLSTLFLFLASLASVKAGGCSSSLCVTDALADVNTHVSDVFVVNNFSLSAPSVNSLDTLFNASKNFEKITSPNVDSGASENATGVFKLFSRKHSVNLNPRMTIRVANNAIIKVAMIGTLVLPVARIPDVVSAKKPHFTTILLHNSLYAPGLGNRTLLSTRSMFYRAGIRTYLNDDLFLQLPSGTRVALEVNAKSYRLPILTKEMSDCYVVDDGCSWDEIHARLCHFSFERLRISRDCTKGINLTSIAKPSAACPGCVAAGMRQSSHTQNSTRKFTFFGERVYSDTIWFPVASTPFNFTRMVCFLDAATRYVALYFMRSDSSVETRGCFEQFLTDVKVMLTPKGVCEWFTDNGTEFFSRDLNTFCRDMHTRHISIVPGMPNANPAERVWGIILRPLRTTLSVGNVTQRCWPFAAVQIAYCHNSLATTSVHAIANVSPYQNATERIPNLSYCHPVFCACKCRIKTKHDEAHKNKLDNTTVDAIFLCIDTRRAGYFVYVKEWNRLTSFTFKEVYFTIPYVYPGLTRILGIYKQGPLVVDLPSEEQQRVHDTLIDPTAKHVATKDRGAEDGTQPGTAGATAPDFTHGTDSTNKTRGEWTADHCEQSACTYPRGHAGPHSNMIAKPRPRPVYVADSVEELNSLVSFDYIADTGLISWDSNHILSVNVEGITKLPVPPTSLSQCEQQKRPDLPEWRLAATEEMAAKAANGTIKEMIPWPDKESVISTRIVYTYKYNETTCASDYRGRWVCRDFLPTRKTLDGTKAIPAADRYVNTPKLVAMRVALARCVQVAGMFLKKLDAIKAYTQVSLPTRVLVSMPDGFRAFNKFGREMVGVLAMALEGLQEAGNLWQTANNEFFTSEKYPPAIFVQSEIDPAVFIYEGPGVLCIAVVWIDDIMVLCNCTRFYNKLRDAYFVRFNAKELVCNAMAGIEIDDHFSDGYVKIHNTRFINNMVAKFGPDVHTRKTPAVFDKNRTNPLSYFNLQIGESKEQRAAMTLLPFLALVASMLYAVCTCRPDVCHDIAALCKFMHLPSTDCYKQALNVLGYLKQFPSRGITYRRIFTISSSINSEFAQIIQLCGGFYFYTDASWKVGHTYAGLAVMFAGGIIDWMSKLIKVICHSSAEAEVLAGSKGGRRIVFIRLLLKDMCRVISGPIVQVIDNTAAKDISEKNGASRRTEHFLRSHYDMRRAQLLRQILVLWAKGKVQLADILTKTLDETTFESFVRECMNERVQ